MTPALLFAFAAAAADQPRFDEPATPEQAIEAQRDEVRRVVDPYCRRPQLPGEILVCGRGRDTESQALPLGPQGSSGRLIAGEAPSSLNALAAGGCRGACAPQGGINVLGVVNGLGRGVDRLLHPD